MGKHSTRRRRRTALLGVVPIVLGSLTGVAALTGSAGASTPPVVVKPSSMQGWGFFDDNGNGGTGQMVDGPPGALGTGSAELAVSASNQGFMLANPAYNGTPISALTKLNYSSFQPGPTLAIALQFDVKYRTSDLSYDGRLIFEPYQNGMVTVPNGREDSHALTGMWWASHQGAANGSGGLCPQSSPCSWDVITHDFQDATIAGNVLFKAGSGWSSFDGNVDNFTIGVNDNDTTFDFEPETPCTTVCYVNAATGNDSFGGDSPSSAKKTIQAAVNQVSSGGQVIVAAGTYNEDVTIDTSLTLDGAQADQPFAGRTAGGPAESTVNGTVTVRAADVTVNGISETKSVPSFAAFGIVVKTAGSGAVIENNLIDGVSTADTGGNGTAQGVYLENGPDNVQILDNAIRNVHSNRSAKGIQLGDSATADPSNGVVIDGNSILGVTSDTKGGYGVQVNTAAGASDLAITNNTFDNLTGGWVHAVGVEADAANVNIAHNTFSNLSASGADKVAVWFESEDTSYGTATVNFNNLAVSPAGGIAVDPALSGSSVDGTCNWWGDKSGPSSAGPGSGAPVSSGVTFSSWLTSSDLHGSCDGNADKPTVESVSMTPSVGNEGTSVTLASSASDPVGLTDIYYNLFDFATGDFVCTLAHVSVPGAPTSYSDTTVLSTPMPFAGLDIGVGGPCPTDGIAEGKYILVANWFNTDKIQAGSPNNQALINYADGAKFSPVIYDNTALSNGKTICDGIRSGHGKDVVVPSGAVCTLLPGTTVDHDVQVQKGGTLIDHGASIGHDLHADKAAGVALDQGASVGHDVTIDGTTGTADGGNRICSSNIGHNLTVQNSAAGAGDWSIGGGVCDDGNSVGQDLNVHGNDNSVDVSNNMVGGNLSVENNANATVNDNTAAHDTSCKKNTVQAGGGNSAGHKNGCPA
jgi:hypothetical protein